MENDTILDRDLVNAVPMGHRVIRHVDEKDELMCELCEAGLSAHVACELECEDKYIHYWDD